MLFCKVIATFFALSTALVQAQECFFPAGNHADNHTPCNSTLSTSMCCNQDEICLSNGLCVQNGLMVRGSCTDKNWGLGCFAQCQQSYNGGGSPLWPCDPYTWACGIGPGDCPTKNFTIAKYNVVLRDFELRSVVAAAGQSLATASTPTNTPAKETSGSIPTNLRAAAPSSTPGTTSPTCEASTPGFAATAMLGVGLGVGLPLLLALLGALFLLRREKKKAKNVTAVQATHNMAAMSMPKQAAVHQEPNPSRPYLTESYAPKGRSSDGQKRAELYNQEGRVELPGTPRHN